MTPDLKKWKLEDRQKMYEEEADATAKKLWGRSASDCLKQQIYVKCGSKATEFKSEKSRINYQMFVFCQKCQDRKQNWKKNPKTGVYKKEKKPWNKKPTPKAK